MDGEVKDSDDHADNNVRLQTLILWWEKTLVMLII